MSFLFGGNNNNSDKETIEKLTNKIHELEIKNEELVKKLDAELLLNKILQQEKEEKKERVRPKFNELSSKVHSNGTYMHFYAFDLKEKAFPLYSEYDKSLIKPKKNISFLEWLQGKNEQIWIKNEKVSKQINGIVLRPSSEILTVLNKYDPDFQPKVIFEVEITQDKPHNSISFSKETDTVTIKFFANYVFHEHIELDKDAKNIDQVRAEHAKSNYVFDGMINQGISDFLKSSSLEISVWLEILNTAFKDIIMLYTSEMVTDNNFEN